MAGLRALARLGSQKAYNAREGIETYSRYCRILNVSSLRQKAYNAREGIETHRVRARVMLRHEGQKAYNAREGIETPGTGSPRISQNCVRKHTMLERALRLRMVWNALALEWRESESIQCSRGH